MPKTTNATGTENQKKVTKTSELGHHLGVAQFPHHTRRPMGTMSSLVWVCFMATAGIGVLTSAQNLEPMRILTPLYAHPTSDFWAHMVDAGAHSNTSYAVVINPASGPGNETDDDYLQGIYDLWDANVEVICYVATGFGQTDVQTVIQDVDKYQQLYPDLCGGFFFDEGPGTEENTYKYTEYYNHVQGINDYLKVVVNPGVTPDESLYHIGDQWIQTTGAAGGQVVIVSFENKYPVFSQDEHEVPAAPAYAQDRFLNAILVYAAFFTTLDEFLAETVFKLYCLNWGYVFFTDDSLGEDGNPWDQTPGYFTSLLDAVANASTAATTEACGTTAPTHAPTPLPVLEPGETLAPVQTASPTEFTTRQPAAIGETIAPVFPAPTVQPTFVPTRVPTPAPTANRVSTPTPVDSADPPTPFTVATPAPFGDIDDTDQPSDGIIRESSSGRSGSMPSTVAVVLTVTAAFFVTLVLPGRAWDEPATHGRNRLHADW